MPSERHENSVDAIKRLVEEQKIGQVLENTDHGGKGGYELPGILCSDNKTRPFIIDCAVRTNHGAMLAFEVDKDHQTTHMKIAMLEKMGWTVIPIPPSYVDEWKKDPELFKKEIRNAIQKANRRMASIQIIQ